jgi:hypothetical protein
MPSRWKYRLNCKIDAVIMADPTDMEIIFNNLYQIPLNTIK